MYVYAWLIFTALRYDLL